MGKKKTAKSSTATKARKPPAGNSSTSRPKKSRPKRHDHEHDHCEHEEAIELDETESKAVDLVLDSARVRNILETEVNSAVTQAVRKICKAHGATLTVAQAQNVALVLFGE